MAGYLPKSQHRVRTHFETTLLPLDPNQRHSEYGAQWQQSTELLICQCFLSSVGEEGTVGAYVLPSLICARR